MKRIFQKNLLFGDIWPRNRWNWLFSDNSPVQSVYCLILSFFILVCEGNTYNLHVQSNYFQKQSPIASLQNVSRKYAANLQEETHTVMWFQKNLRSTSAWVLQCKFTGDLQNIFLEHLWGTGSVFYCICFGASNK